MIYREPPYYVAEVLQEQIKNKEIGSGEYEETIKIFMERHI